MQKLAESHTQEVKLVLRARVRYVWYVVQFISPCTEIVAEYTFPFCLTIYVHRNLSNLAGQLVWCFPSYLLESKAVGAVGLFLLINEGRGSDRYAAAGGEVQSGSCKAASVLSFNQSSKMMTSLENLRLWWQKHWSWNLHGRQQKTSDHHRFIEILGKTQIFTIDKD